VHNAGLHGEARITPRPSRNVTKEIEMNINLNAGLIAPIVSLIAGILILVAPRLLNYIVAIYLIVIGLVGLFGSGGFHIR
jgi:hypothetical protein